LAIAGFVALEMARGLINSLAVGTSFVPQNQLAQIHKGEMVVPQSFSDAIRKGDITLSGGSQAPATTRKAQRAERVGVAVSHDYSGFQSFYDRARADRGTA
jgi:hypothetical protein